LLKNQGEHLREKKRIDCKKKTQSGRLRFAESVSLSESLSNPKNRKGQMSAQEEWGARGGSQNREYGRTGGSKPRKRVVRGGCIHEQKGFRGREHVV